jgi:hypothetical protein
MAETVKIKLLKSTPIGNAGDVVDVPKPLAEQMCQWRKLHDGHKEVDYRQAMLASEKEPEPVVETAAQALAAGKKNVVETPKEEAEPAAPASPGDTTSEGARSKKNGKSGS